MPISFAQVPSNWKMPLYWVEIDPSKAGLPVANQPALLVGQMLTTGIGLPDVAVPIGTQAQADQKFGQGSQLVEEGQRALTRGVLLLGGIGGESLGTGWGNIQAVYYGRVQRALCDPDTPEMPLTRPTRRGAPLGVQPRPRRRRPRRRCLSGRPLRPRARSASGPGDRRPGRAWLPS